MVGVMIVVRMVFRFLFLFAVMAVFFTKVMNIVKEPDVMGFFMADGVVLVAVVIMMVTMAVIVVIMMAVACAVAPVAINCFLIVPVVRLVPMILNIVGGLTVSIAIRRLCELE